MISRLFRDTVTLSRAVATGNKTTYSTVGDPFACHIQPIEENYSASSMGRNQKTFRLFSTTEVRIGDRLVDQNTVSYEVIGAKRLSFRNKSHYEAELRGV